MKNAEKSKMKSRPNGATVESKAAAGSLRSLQREREERRFMMRVRLAKRDLDYAESPCAAKATVEERGGVRIETRGRAVVGFAAASCRVAY